MTYEIIVSKTYIPRPTQSAIDSGGVLDNVFVKIQKNGIDVTDQVFTINVSYYTTSGSLFFSSPYEIGGNLGDGNIVFVGGHWQNNVSYVLITSPKAPNDVVRINFQQPGEPNRGPTYEIVEVSPSPMEEGKTAQIRVKASNQPSDQQVYIQPDYDNSQAKIDDLGLINTASVQFDRYNEAIINLSIRNDGIAEPLESIVLNLRTAKTHILLASKREWIKDYTPPLPPPPSYQITESEISIGVGGKTRIRIMTQNRGIGGEMYYSIRSISSGIMSGDIDMNINEYISFRTVAPGADYEFDITALNVRSSITKQFQILVYDGNGVPGTQVLTSRTITIQGTAIPKQPELFVEAVNGLVHNEGASIQFRFTLKNPFDVGGVNENLLSVTYPYIIVGSTDSDFQPSSVIKNSGNITFQRASLDIRNPEASVILVSSIANDMLTEGNENWTMQVKGPQGLVSLDLIIRDTSLSLPAIYSMRSSKPDNRYIVDETIEIIVEVDGQPTTISVPFTVSPTTGSGIKNGIVMLNDTQSATISGLTTRPGSYQVYLSGGLASITIDVVPMAQLMIDVDKTEANEGDTINIQLLSSDPSQFTGSEPWIVKGFKNSTGTISIDISQDLLNATGQEFLSIGDSDSFSIIQDMITEGTEYIRVCLANKPSVVSPLIKINDTSKAPPTFDLIGPSMVTENGGNISIILITTELPNGTVVPYGISGVDEMDINIPLNGFFVIQSNRAELIFRVTPDLKTEGTETMRIAISFDGQTRDMLDIIISDTSVPPTFDLTSPTDVNEGQRFTVRLDTTGIINNTLIPFTVTGVQSSDIRWRATPGTGSWSSILMGTFQISSNFDEIEFEVIADRITEGSEIMVLTLDNLQDSVSILINDTSMDPTYSLSGPVSANEGTSFIVRLDTTNISNGYVVPFEISGVSGTDIRWRATPGTGSYSFVSSGNFIVNSNFDEIEFEVIADRITEGSETMTLTLVGITKSISVILNDTSLDPTYTLVAPSSVNEGAIFNIRLDTTNILDGTSIPFTISGITNADFRWRQSPGSGVYRTTLTGSFIVNSNFDEIEIEIFNDIRTEGTEMMVLSLNGGLGLASIQINDTSIDPSYSLSGPPFVNEGDTFTIQLDTTNINDGTLVPFSITGLTSGEYRWRLVGSANWLSTSNGNFNILANVSEIEIEILIDAQIEIGEKIIISLTNGFGSLSIDVFDRTPGLMATPSNQISEGETITITLVNMNVPDGTLVPYTLSGISSTDLVGGRPIMDNFQVMNQMSSVVYTIATDTIINENDTFILTLQNFPISVIVPIIDRSPTYQLSGSPNTIVNEGSVWEVTLTTTNLQDGAMVPYTITGVSSGDISISLTGNFVITNNIAQISIPIIADGISEALGETMILTLDGGLGSISVEVLDEPTYQLSSIYTPTATQAYPGQMFEVRLTTERLEPGTQIPFTITGLGDGDVEEDLITQTQEGGNIVYQSNTITGYFVPTYLNSIQRDQFRIFLSVDLPITGSRQFTISLDNGQASLTLDILEDPTVTLFNQPFLYNPSGFIADIDSASMFTYDPATYSGKLKNTGNGGNGGTKQEWDLVSGSQLLTNDDSEPIFQGIPGSYEPSTHLLFSGSSGKYLQQRVVAPQPGFDFKPYGVMALGVLEMAWQLPRVPTNGSDIVYLLHLGQHNSPNFTRSWIRYNYTNHQLEFMAAGLQDQMAMPVEAIGNAWLLTIKATPGSIQCWINGRRQQFITGGNSMTTGYTDTDQGGHFAVVGGDSTMTSSSAPYSNDGYSAKDGANGGEIFYFIRFWQYSNIPFGDTEAENNFAYSAGRIGAGGFQTFSPGESYILSTIGAPQEGGTITVKLETSGVPNGSQIPYTVTGISQNDLSSGSLTGVFVVNASSINYGVAEVNFGILGDRNTEGDEDFTISLDGRNETLSITIQDTSRDDPIVPPSSTLAGELAVKWYDPSDVISYPSISSATLNSIRNQVFGIDCRWNILGATFVGTIGQSNQNTYMEFPGSSSLVRKQTLNFALLSNRYLSFELAISIPNDPTSLYRICSTPQLASYRGEIIYFGSSKSMRFTFFRNDGKGLVRNIVVQDQYLDTVLHIGVTHLGNQTIVLFNGQQQTFTDGLDYVDMPQGNQSFQYYGFGFLTIGSGSGPIPLKFYFMRHYGVSLTEAELINNLGYSLNRLGLN